MFPTFNNAIMFSVQKIKDGFRKSMVINQHSSTQSQTAVRVSPFHN